MNNKELISSSLDMKYYRRSAILLGSLCIVFSAITVGFEIFLKTGILPAYTALFVIFFAPFIVYYIYKIATLTNDNAGYVLCEAKLEEVHHTWNRKIYLILGVVKGNGKKVRASTSGIFSQSVLSDLYYGEFYQRNIKILYDETTGSVIVLGIKDESP